jgi:hypothetical protein
MNEALAKIHFPDDVEEPLDLYNEKLFRFKQFYFQRNPIPKVTQQKIKELQDLDAAFELRFPQLNPNRAYTPVADVVFSKFFSTDYKMLQHAQTIFKGRVATCQHALDLSEYLEDWYNLEVDFARTYGHFYEEDDLTAVQLTQNEDVMLINQRLAANAYFNLHADYQWNKNDIALELQDVLKRCAKFIVLHKRII